MFVKDLMTCKQQATLTLCKTKTSEIFLINNQNGYREVLPHQKDTFVLLRKDTLRLYHLHILSLKIYHTYMIFAICMEGIQTFFCFIRKFYSC
jgi:hypothetical protein